MSSLICISAVAVILVFTLWAVLRPRISFERFPLPDYRKELEFAIFFLPGGLAGWLSILVAYSYLAEEANTFNLAWSLSLVVAFVILEFLGIFTLALAGDSIKAAQNADGRDFIALGTGYVAGVLIGTYDIIVHQPQPPNIFFFLDKEAIEDIFIVLGIVAFFGLNVTLLQYMRKRRKKGEILKSSASQDEVLAAPELEPDNKSLNTEDEQEEVDENPSTSVNI